MCQSPDDDAASCLETHPSHVLTGLSWLNLDDPYYLARHQRKGKLIDPSLPGLDLHDHRRCRLHAFDASQTMSARIYT